MKWVSCAHKENKGHAIDRDQAVSLDKAKHWKGRKIKEAIFIDAQNPTKEVREKIMNLETGFVLEPVEDNFNAETRGFPFLARLVHE